MPSEVENGKLSVYIVFVKVFTEFSNRYLFYHG
jgi:hypothetical protein